MTAMDWCFERFDRCYFSLGLSLGVLYLLVIPPFQTPDEPHHFYRCYQISMGQVLAERRGVLWGGLIPHSLAITVEETTADVPFHPEKKVNIAVVVKALHYPLDEQNVGFLHFPSGAWNSPVPYLPQVAGITLGKTLQLSPLLLMYLGRGANLLVTVWLCAWALHLTPIFRPVFFLLASTPMFIHQAASLSPDGMTNGLSLLLIAAIVRESLSPDVSLHKGNLALITTLAVAVALCKSAYFPLALAYFLIPVEKIGSRTKYYTLGITLVCLSAGTAFVWTLVLGNLQMPLLPGLFTDLYQPQAFILAHPLVFSKMVAVNFLAYGPFYLRSVIGHLGWLDTRLPTAFVALYAVILCGVSLLSGEKHIALPYHGKLLFSAIAVTGAVLIIAVYFFVGTKADSSSIIMVQGRYFIPYAPLILLLFYNQPLARRFSPLAMHRFVSAFAAGSLLFALWCIVQRYYLP